MINYGYFICQILNVQGEQHEASDNKSPPRSKREAERYTNSSTSDAQSQQHGFIGMSTSADELSYTRSHEEKTRDVDQVFATGWKTQRRKGEAVWPPSL